MESPHLGTVIHHLSKTHKIFFPQHIQRGFFFPLCGVSSIDKAYVCILSFIRCTLPAGSQGLTQRRLKRQTTVCCPSSPQMRVFQLWEDAGIPGENPKRKAQGSSLQPSRCEATPSTTTMALNVCSFTANCFSNSYPFIFYHHLFHTKCCRRLLGIYGRRQHAPWTNGYIKGPTLRDQQPSTTLNLESPTAFLHVFFWGGGVEFHDVRQPRRNTAPPAKPICLF